MAKIILIDVDGTLVNYENELPDSAVEAIRTARLAWLWEMAALKLKRMLIL